MVKIQINGTYFEVREDKNLLETCIALGFDLPYFCYHPAMGSVGACRQCAVKKFANADDKRGRIIMSCMEPVTEGLIISIDDTEAREFRASVVEGLMTNHPHDCPICDEGGECHLQDMTVMTGHNYRRFEFKKRTHLNQNLGPFIQHEMNRCIQCYRCVRFYKDYAGGKDLNVFGSAAGVYFGRQQDGTLESEFSGNLVEVCPTGVFTDKTLKQHYTRKWDLTNTPSLCVHCSVGCNTIIGERYGTVRRVMSRYNGDVNGYFLCDRGRFGYEFLNHEDRIKDILVKTSDTGQPEIAYNLHEINGFSASLNTGRIIGIGSPRASLEANFALQTLTGKNNFFHGISRQEYELTKKAVGILSGGSVGIPSLKESEKCDAVFIMGEDITQTAPMLALAMRQATRNKSLENGRKIGIPEWNDAATRELAQDVKSPLFIASPFSTKLDDAAMETFHAAPADIARLGFAVAAAIHPEAPGVQDLDETSGKLAGRIAAALLEAKNPLIVTGITGGTDDMLNALVNIVSALSNKGKKPGISITFPESNSVGLALMDGRPLEDALELAGNDSANTLVILENDLYRRISAEKIDAVLNGNRNVIVLDHLKNPTVAKAGVVLPVATYAESAGTMVNNEGRSQRFYPVMPLQGSLKESWQWIATLMKDSGKNSAPGWNKFDDVVAALCNAYGVFSPIQHELPDAGFRYFNEKIARQPMRYSGRTAMNAKIAVSEPGPSDDPDSPLNFSMEGYKGNPPSALIPNYWTPGFNSVQAVNTYLDEPNGSLKDSDPGVLLFRSQEASPGTYVKNIPDCFIKRNDAMYFVPAYRIFGSEELSSRAKAINGRIPKPFVLINHGEAARIKAGDNKPVKIMLNGISLQAEVVTDDTVPDGVAGLSVLLPGMSFTPVPGWSALVPVTEGNK